MIQAKYKYRYFSPQHLVYSFLKDKNISKYYITPFLSLDLSDLPNIYGRIKDIPITLGSQDINYDLLYYSLKRDRTEYLTVIHVEWENYLTGNRLNPDSMRIISEQFADSIVWVVDITNYNDFDLELFNDLPIIVYSKGDNWCEAISYNKLYALPNWISEHDLSYEEPIKIMETPLILGRQIRRALIDNPFTTYIGNEDMNKNWSILYFKTSKSLPNGYTTIMSKENNMRYYRIDTKGLTPLNVRTLLQQLNGLKNA